VTSVVRRLDRLGGQLTKKVFPGHWSFLLGELAMFSFLVLVATGVYLAWFYDTSMAVIAYEGSYEPLVGVEVTRAYHSVLDITFDQPAGGVVRQAHHWAALVFVAAIVLHAARVFFTGAFRRPRRLNWTIGVTMMGLAMAAGFFGLALPHDLLGGTGARIGYAFAVSIPVIGPGVADFVFGGEFGNDGMLHRFWLFHVFLLPLAIAGLLGLHLTLVFLQSHTQFADRRGRRRADNVVGAAAWPGYLLKATAAFALVVGVLLALGALVEIGPIWIYGPFDAAAATVPAQPDWYLGWVEGALRIFPGLDLVVFGREVPSPFFVGVAFPAMVFAILLAWPFAEARITGDHDKHHLLDRPRDRPVRTALGVAGLSALTVLLAAGSHDLQALLLRVPVDSLTWAYRWLFVLVPIAAGIATWGVCRSLARSEAEGLGQPDSGDERTRLDPDHPRSDLVESAR
jgi:ubiquinol-cytochrome c reductase cytochrome b subunit